MKRYFITATLIYIVISVALNLYFFTHRNRLFGISSIIGLNMQILVILKKMLLEKETCNLIIKLEISLLNADWPNMEKERLMSKIHHMVNNNLQIVIRFLNTQSAYMTSLEALYAISQVHQKSYQIDSFSTIYLSLYNRTITSHKKVA